MTPLLEIEALTVDYAGAPALSGIDLDLAAGEAVAVLGPNGAGKSSLLPAELRMGALYYFPVLAERGRDMAWRLSGGQQQMLAIGRALMPFPRLLLMDEPSLGLAPVVAAELFAALAQLVDGGEVAILLVEQNVGDALALCHRVIRLDRGRIVAPGPGAATAPSYGQVD